MIFTKMVGIKLIFEGIKNVNKYDNEIFLALNRWSRYMPVYLSINQATYQKHVSILVVTRPGGYLDNPALLDQFSGRRN